MNFKRFTRPGVFYVFLLLVFSIMCILLFLNLVRKTPVVKTKATVNEEVQCPSNMTILRQNSSELTHPFILADVETESAKYNPLKGILSKTIQEFEKKGSVNNVSVYVRLLADGSWMSVEGDHEFFPGSLMKVPIMIYYLTQEDRHRGSLNKELFYVKPKENFPAQFFRGDSIKPGRNYKISELLRYMIEESDNNATFLLSKNIQPDLFRKIFVDLGIPPDEPNDIKYKISARNYAKFFRVLYNATYLDEHLSQYALDLLAHCKFTEGIARKLPMGTIIARKFGERGFDNQMDFSEAGIVYKDGDPYVIVVMTEGTNYQQQVDLISEISAEVFQNLKTS